MIGKGLSSFYGLVDPTIWTWIEWESNWIKRKWKELERSSKEKESGIRGFLKIEQENRVKLIYKMNREKWVSKLREKIQGQK